MPITKRQAADVQNAAMAQAQGITTGGITPEGVIEITENGLFDVAEYAQANVNVPGVEITDGIVVKSRDASGYITELDHYGTLIGASQYRSQSAFAFANLSKINVKSDYVDVSTYGLSGIKVTDTTSQELFPFIKSLRGFSLASCPNITEINLPNCENIGIINANKSGDGCFKYCSKLTKLILPKLQFVNTGTNEDGVCAQLANLRELIVGSVGHPYRLLDGNSGHFFYQQTSPDIVATFFVENITIGNAVISRERGGAPNATIIIKDSTTGETLVTSTPT